MKKVYLLALVLIIKNVALAQEKELSTDMTDQQKAKLTAIIYELDNKIKPVLAQNQALQSQMQKDIKSLSALKDDKALAAAITNYQAKYNKAYGDILKKAGIDMAAYVKQLSAAFPGLVFSITGGYGIKAEAKQAAARPQPAPGPVTSAITNYELTKHVGCGGAAGGSVTSTRNSINAFGLATIAGGCVNDGTLKADVVVPKAKTASIHIRHTLKTNAFAVGVLGTGICSSSTYCNASEGRGRSYSWAFAPVLWVAYDDDEVREDYFIAVTPNTNKKISYYVRINPMAGLPAETHGSASATSINNDLTTQQ